MNVSTPMSTEPERWAVPVFAATAIVTVPAPEPDAPLVTVSQPALLVAAHAQPAPAVTATVVVSPALGDVLLAGAIE